MRREIRPAESRDVAGIFHVRISASENVPSHAELAGLGMAEASIAAMSLVFR